MRWSSILTLLCSAAALILSFLCLFAGSKRSFLQNGDLLTLNMSRLGYLGDTFNTTDGDGGFLDNLINDAQEDVNDLINDATTEIASQLNISDFYSVHLMNYCEGMFEPNGTAAANGSDVSKNTTYCSPRNSAFHFNVTEIVQSALPDEISLGDIQWPEEVTDAQNLIRTASIATEVLYIIGIVFTGLALLGAIFGFFTEGRLSACCNVIVDLIALIALIAASAVATVVIVKAVNALNKYGNDIGVSATKGDRFLGMTWAATGLMLIATIVSIAQLIKGKKNGGYISEMRQKH
ncbi:hypothetical protein PMZ80_005925 [Knufia obscura]|uniref:Uncharacterized protein n=2 Tax=Knufia TaxID=430999 RepID=A0AAN8EI73_9EURO|nr:hypothetical protein PMZ80_005925 [Knufia obscura]KAK5954595.1 hypothetical protein OHC33_004317 [Knufia fluminis]